MSEDKNLSGEEKRRLMKEQFKQELKGRKDFIQKVENLRKLQNINKALDNMNYQDDSDEWIGKLNQESAFTEAKMEIALESASSVQEGVANEKDIEKFVAEELVKQLKREIAIEKGEILPEEPAAKTAADATDSADAENASENGGGSGEDDRPHRKMLEDLDL